MFTSEMKLLEIIFDKGIIINYMWDSSSHNQSHGWNTTGALISWTVTFPWIIF